MNNNTLKFSLFVQSSANAHYQVIGAELVKQDQDLFEYCGWHDPHGTTTVIVKLDSIADPQDRVLIKKLVVGGVELNNMQQWSSYVLADGSVVPLTHGWVDRPGQYRLKMRYSPLSQNHMSYFLSICPKS